MDERAYIERSFGVRLQFCFWDQWPTIKSETAARTDIVMLQPFFDVTADEFGAVVDFFREANPAVQFIVFDYSAPTDLRLGPIVHDAATVFVKKHKLVDDAVYARPTRGDTHLADAYAKIYDLDLPVKHYPLPDRFLDKVVTGPTFYTEYFLSRSLLEQTADIVGVERPIDVHARLAGGGSPLYSAIRDHAIDSVKTIDAPAVLTAFPVSTEQFNRELAQSKICFSPFGHGEICWRDVEAIASGALLVKPDVSHIALDPPFLVAGETYAAVEWDYSDLADVVARYLADQEAREAMARRAFEALQSYLRERRYETHLKTVFDSIGG
ncbi:MAG: glycosyltransferase [Pseudomonadota bacterium]